MPADKTAIIHRVIQLIQMQDTEGARKTLCAEYPFVSVVPKARRYTEAQSLRVFLRDGFVDRYTGQRLVFPGIFRLLHRLVPIEFPFHQNWKMAETHPTYWELFPTIDHVIPIARGGADRNENWVTTTMLRNTAKSNSTLAELGWVLHEPGALSGWDGIMALFVEIVESDTSVLQDAYLRRWHAAAIRSNISA